MHQTLASLLLVVALLSSIPITTYQVAQDKGANQAAIPAPADVFGFVPGEDRNLASWQQVVEYFDSAHYLRKKRV